jgi:hypothetical protein
MRLHIQRLMIAAVLFTTVSPVAAQSATTQIEIKSFGSFSIKKENVPAGCSILHIYGRSDDEERGEITCDSQSQFDQGFVISSNFTKACAANKNGKVVCTIAKSKS